MPPLKYLRPIPSFQFKDIQLQTTLAGLKDAIMDLQGINNRSSGDRLLTAEDLEEGGKIFTKFIRSDGSNAGIKGEQNKPVEFPINPIIIDTTLQVSGVTVMGKTTRTRKTSSSLGLTVAGTNAFDWTIFAPASCVLSADLGAPGLSLNSDHIEFITEGYYRVTMRADFTVASARTLQISQGITSAANVWTSGTILKETAITETGTGVLFDVIIQASANDLLVIWSTLTGAIDLSEIDLLIEHYLV